MEMEVLAPDGVSGDWRVESFTITEEEARRSVRGMLRPNEYVPPGTYKRLMRGRTVVMSNTPFEVRTNWPIVHHARGHALINGLGLGMVLHAILKKPELESVTVVENSPDVLRLVAPTFADDPRVTIVEGDAFTYRPPKGARFDAAWHDIWDFICGDNLPQMHTLHRRYARRARWQGSWARLYCERR